MIRSLKLPEDVDLGYAVATATHEQFCFNYDGTTFVISRRLGIIKNGQFLPFPGAVESVSPAQVDVPVDTKSISLETIADLHAPTLRKEKAARQAAADLDAEADAQVARRNEETLAALSLK